MAAPVPDAPVDAAEAAGVVTRAAAMVVDLVLLAVAITATAWFVDAVEDLVRPYRDVDLGAFVIAAAPVIAIAYFVVGWVLFGQTVGKALLGLRVVDRGGGALRPATALARVLAYVVSALPLYLGFVWVMVDPGRRAWHDRLAGTRVVYATSAGRVRSRAHA